MRPALSSPPAPPVPNAHPPPGRLRGATKRTSASSILRLLPRSHPVQGFRTDPRFYLRYDATYFVLCAALCALLAASGFHGVLARVHWDAVRLGLGLGAAAYFLICCHLWIHNATHGNFPRPINRLVGELLGFIVFVRFASWQIVHLRHHASTDDAGLDPHPAQASFFASFLKSVVTVERRLQDSYCELWGETPENRRHEAVRARVSYATNVVVALAWYLLLGPIGFFALWLPGNLLAAAFVGHFNWATHNGEAGKDFRPVNLDGGRYWLGNRLFMGIYFHANHHRRPHLFNPRKWCVARHGLPEPAVDLVRIA